MKKLNLALFLSLPIQTFFAQIISKDPSFGVNGEYTVTPINVPTGGIYQNMGGQILQHPDGSLYYSSFPGYTFPGGIDVTSTRKLSSNGTLDTSFGNNGELASVTSFTIFDYVQELNGKLLTISKNDNSHEYIIKRLLPNGQPDPTFGTNGTITTIFAFDSCHHSGFVIQNNKILVYGSQNVAPNVYNKIIYRLNADGSTDTSFGSNGLITSQTTALNEEYNTVLVDKQSNIINICFNSIEKYTPNGQPFTGFGNNGKVQLPSNYYANTSYEDLLVDENNKIIYAKDNTIYRVNPDGTFDDTLNFIRPTFPLPPSYPFTNTPYTGRIINIKEKNGFYYVLWALEENNSAFSPMLISKHLQNGTADSAFGSYSEGPVYGDFMHDMVINDNNIIVSGDYRIVKYLLANPTLSTNEVNSTPFITFENPANDVLVYKTQEKISEMQMYTLDGKLVKTIEKNNTNISELPKGIYFLKTKFINGKVIITKLLKK
ncbi:T9SS C-terminal target domain-containing protein [Chryseobacterium joostei]|uniref:Delta-60 repeat domain-containing protein/Por secretion system C-terminal sorting domain-containing protein n=1 Tax=Chryseobacterium joostei TaxID=112234 RepID=A0A1N7ICX5_9FLAO|nr:T9SS type A sorting domain-containing protein [Chryseobacterium joostei]AZB01970.1 T9SS C-terminal target domain-containing protein [Chryseobacterium joostei]SIS34934.1 delta-60 repeat domain-containing protein/Por secretion system C-terminal sorting domain-containing protein [Chryseobacterium joostei]